MTKQEIWELADRFAAQSGVDDQCEGVDVKLGFVTLAQRDLIVAALHLAAQVEPPSDGAIYAAISKRDPRGPFNLANGRFERDVSDAVMTAQDAEIKELRARVTELLQFNNEFEERARQAERKLRVLEVADASPQEPHPSTEWLAKEIAEKTAAMMTGQSSYLQHIIKCAETILDRVAAPQAARDALQAFLTSVKLGEQPQDSATARRGDQ